MKKITELDLGFNDAENYKLSDRKQFFEKIFVRTNALDNICKSRTSFIVGEKGTGKTAYAVFITNTSYKDNHSSIRHIRETDFLKFIQLKNEHQLSLSDYTSIWRVIVYVLMSEQIVDRESRFTSLSNYRLIAQLKEVIDEYHEHAFAPEIINVLRFLERSEAAAKLSITDVAFQGGLAKERESTESTFQINLLVLRKQFEEAFRSAKLSRNHILFVDGIDIRPQSVPYEDYLNCIKGLANAVWDVNNDLFGTVKDSLGRLRIVLLVRPDIFQLLGLQNQNAKIRDNSVLLDWRTTEEHHSTSNLFQVVDQLLNQDNGENSSEGTAWDYYFPSSSRDALGRFDRSNSFVNLLRLSLHRPRDFVTMLSILQETAINENMKEKTKFTFPDIESINFKNFVSDYLLGEIKDHILFYYSNDDYEVFLKFFEFLYGSVKFSYEEYEVAYDLVLEHLQEIDRIAPRFMENASQFLQFLFDLNVICYIEEGESGDQFNRWCFRERSYSTIAPKVKQYELYEVHVALRRALNLGKNLKKRDRYRKGKLKWFDDVKGYGFIRAEKGERDIFFHKSILGKISTSRLVPGTKIHYVRHPAKMVV